MKTVTDYVKMIAFQVKWLLVPEEARYAYLWNRTKKSRYASRL
ncbi:hypothetical protein ACFLS8_02665 [Chloroflexota bacterium]